MNEFLEQFVIEARELVEQATGDLLALEAAPGDRGRLDGVFRCIHTLKGGAGIVGFNAMSRVLHAAEETLSDARAGGGAVSPGLAGDCLACLDQVTRWLDAIAAAGELPQVSDAEAGGLAAQFGAAAPVSVTEDWLPGLLDAHPAARGGARLALRYVPDADALMRGEDPLELAAGLPGLLAFTVAPRAPWPPLERLDPFACNLVITALSVAGEDEVAAALAGAGGATEFRPIAPAPEVARLSADAIAVLEEQLALLRLEPHVPGRFGAAGLVAARVLRHAGQVADAAAVEAALAAGAAAPLAGLLQALLHPAEAPTVQGDRAMRSLRVDVERIDALVKLAGELAVAKNALGHAARLARARTDADPLKDMLRGQHMQLERLAEAFQHAVLAMRLLPLRQVFQRLPRLVHGLARELGKPARLVTAGDATEADKMVVEGLFEPLTHLVRNALDHGIEPEAVRQAAGKPAVATLGVRAAREGDQVIVEISDDGSGIDLERVRAVAVARGMAEAAAMPDAEAMELLFRPGFSTAAAVTGVSGRGVGMDAVHTAVARIGGRVEIASRRGAGTTIRLTLPFAVILSRVMTVEAGGQVFGIPLDAIVETARVPRARIAGVGAAAVFVLRDRAIPLVDLAVALGLPPPESRAEASIVVTSAAGQPGALEVERFGEPMDIVLTPMAGLLAGTPGLAGTTLLGDGRVMIVLNVQELLQ